jgi:SAM-dependent methyltransferase
MKKLNLGCGSKYLEGWINLDNNKNNKADVYWNLDEFPWPFKDCEFDYILMDAVLEHLDDPVRALKEAHRILKEGGVLKIKVPHYTSTIAYGDLTHKHFFSYKSIYVEPEKGVGFNTFFKVVSWKINFGKKYAFWNYVIEYIANKFPTLYESTPLRMFPAFTIEVVLKKE